MFRAGIQKNPLYFKRNKIFLYFLLFFCYNSIRVRGRVCIFPCVFYLHLAFCWMLFFKWRKRLKYEKKLPGLPGSFFIIFSLFLLLEFRRYLLSLYLQSSHPLFSLLYFGIRLRIVDLVISAEQFLS